MRRYPLDPGEGPTAWVECDGDGMIHFKSGTDPDDPTDCVSLNRREFGLATTYVKSSGILD